jgi:hypothetical protein
MSGKVVGWAFEQGKRLSSSQLLVLVAIADNSDDYGEAWPSRKRLIEKTRLSKSTVYRSVDDLRDLGLLEFGFREGGTKCFRLAVKSQGGTASHSGTDQSQGGTQKSQGGTPYREPSTEPSEEPTPTPSGQVREVFDFWVKTLDKGHHKLTPKRRKRIETRLGEGCTVEELKEAIVGLTHSPHHMGTKPDSTRSYDDLELICRTPDSIETFRDLFREQQRAKHRKIDPNAEAARMRREQGLDP